MGPGEGGSDEGCIPCQRRRSAIRQDDGGGERKRRKDGRKDLSHSAAISVFLVVKKHFASFGWLGYTGFRFETGGSRIVSTHISWERGASIQIVWKEKNNM